MSRIVVLVNGDRESALAARASGLFEPLSDELNVSCVHRRGSKPAALAVFFREIARTRPDLAYVVDAGVSNAGAAIAARTLFGTPFVLDVGDLAYELARATGRHGAVGRAIVRGVEALALRTATAVVVRGTHHKTILEERGQRSVWLVRDGVDVRGRRERDDRDLRQELALGDSLCVGMMGALRWNRRHGMCYGWDLVEAMSLIDPGVQVCAVVVGDGDGLPHLRRRASELGVEHRVRFVGRIPYADVSRYLRLFNVAISTQTNDDVGRVRTTGKLPEYMAAGCYVIATDVGEARLLLSDPMRLPYEGVKDLDYPLRLARKIEEIAALDPEDRRAAGCELIMRARRDLDYEVLARQLGKILGEALPEAAPRRRGRPYSPDPRRVIALGGGRTNYVVDSIEGHPEKILDIGCAFGWTLAALEGRANELWGVDVDADALREARLNYPGIRFIHQSGKSLPFADEEFDVVILSEVLEHVEDKEKDAVVEEAHRVLKDNGLLVFTVPYAGLFAWADPLDLKRRVPWLYRLYMARFGYDPKTAPAIGHRHFSHKEIEGLFADRFSIDEIRYCGLFMPFMTWILVIGERLHLFPGRLTGALNRFRAWESGVRYPAPLSFNIRIRARRRAAGANLSRDRGLTLVETS